MTRRGISGPQVEATWNRVMQSSKRDFDRLQRKAGPFQEELSAFVLAYTYSMRAPVAAMAREMMICIFEVYHDHVPKVRAASEAAVKEQWEVSKRGIDEMEVLVDAGEGYDSLLADHPQPALMATVLGVLLDVDPSDEDDILSDLEEDGPELDDDEVWRLLAVMHTVLGVLESHAIRPSAAG